MEFNGKWSGDILATVSIDVSFLKPSDTTIDDLIHRLSNALFCSKINGRNQVSIH